MFKKINLLIILSILVFNSASYGEDKQPQGMPPAVVVVSDIVSGMVTPESEFVGTVYFQEVSDVASEVSGKVEEVSFEEGQRVENDQTLVKLNSDLLEKTVQARISGYEQVLSDLEKAQRDLTRAANLYKEELISEQTYDDRRFSVSNIEKKASALRSEVEQIETELSKKIIKAPFDGIVIDKHVDRGEWVSPGTVVASIARDDMVDIITEVPEAIISNVKKGIEVKVFAGGNEIEGEVAALVPKGDISTRTFPVKIKAKNTHALIEGMEAKVTLPSGDRKKTLIVPRDAVINSFGKMIVYTVNDSKASMVPVTIVGYAGMNVGIAAEGLAKGMQVITKGHERLRPGQPVMIKGSQ